MSNYGGSFELSLNSLAKLLFELEAVTAKSIADDSLQDLGV